MTSETLKEQYIITLEKEIKLLVKTIESLTKEFEQYQRESIKWSVEDFTKFEGYKISKQKAQEALEDMILHHDCTIGITWDTVEYYLKNRLKL